MSAPPARFARPDASFRDSWLEALREYHDEGRHDELDEDLLADREAFARYCDALNAAAVQPGEPDVYLAELRGTAPRGEWRDGYVPYTVLWWTAGHDYLGRLTIRHRLTPHLLYHGGNIGFEVRPSARRRGHATAMLAAALPLAAALGIDPARLDCEAGNVASRRVIEANGGLLDEERDGSLFFWAPTR
ncbi:MAG TPA: GNAT family N-acetyltransferase [Thermoleophilia bacterium]|nr:GNAT family N-acetyltransferase [Thermoleophilia bacterium]